MASQERTPGNPENAVLAREAWELVDTLPLELREVIDLRFSRGLTFAEAAVALEIPQSTVKARESSALERLREKLSGSYATPAIVVGERLSELLMLESAKPTVSLPANFLSNVEATVMASIGTKFSFVAIAACILLLLGVGAGVTIFWDDIQGRDRPALDSGVAEISLDADTAAHTGKVPAIGASDSSSVGKGEDSSNSHIPEESGPASGRTPEPKDNPPVASGAPDSAGTNRQPSNAETVPGKKEDELDPAIVTRIGGLANFESTTQLLAVDISPDSKTIATADFGPIVRLWDRATGKLLHAVRLESANNLRSVCFHPTSAYVIASGETYEGKIGVWRVADGERSATIIVPGREPESIEMEITCLKYSPDGTLLYASGASGLVSVFDVADGRLVRSIDAHPGRISTFTLSVDGMMLYTTGEDQQLRAWNLAENSMIFERSLDGKLASSLSLSSDGRILLVVDGRFSSAASTFDAADGGLLRRFSEDCKSDVSGVISPADSRYAILANHYGAVELWNVDYGIMMDSVKTRNTGFLITNVNRDGSLFVTVGSPGVIELWQIEDGHIVPADNDIAGRDEKGRFACIAAMHQTNAIAVAHDDGHFEVRGIPDGKVLHTFENSTPWGPCTLAVSPDDRWLAAGYGGSPKVDIWSLKDFTLRHQIKKHKGNIGAFAFDNAARYLFSADWVGAINMWDITSGQCVREFIFPRDDSNPNPNLSRCQSLLMVDDFLVAGFDDLHMRCWDATTGALRFEVKAHTHWVKGLARIPNTQTFLSTSVWDPITLWDVQEGTLIATIPNRGSDQLVVDKSGSILLTPMGIWKDGNPIGNGMLQHWDISNINSPKTYTVHKETVRAVQISSDSRYAITLGTDNTLAFIDLEYEGH